MRRTRLFAAGLSLVCFLGVCGLTRGSVRAADERQTSDIINNGGRFVKDGEEIYFAAGTTLYAYNEMTGEQREVAPFEREYYEGDAALYCSNGWIYFEDRDPGEERSVVRRINEETGESEDFCIGYPAGASEDSRYLFIVHYEDGTGVTGMYEDGKLLTEWREDGEYVLNYGGSSGDYVFFERALYESEKTEHRIMAARLSRPDDLFAVGDMPCPNEDGTWYEYPQVTQVLTDGNQAYFSLSYYGGTGMFYNYGYVCRADLTVENSLQVLEEKDYASDVLWESGLYDEAEQMLTGEVYLALKDGSLQIVPGQPGTAKYSGPYAGSGILMYDEDGRESLAYEGLVPASDPETFLHEELQDVVLLDGVCYCAWTRLMSDPSQAIGWRDHYEKVYTEYVKIDADGTVTILQEEPAGLTLCGHVALGADNSYLYFQPVDMYEDTDGMITEAVSDTCARVYTSEENVVSGWEEFLQKNTDSRRPLSSLGEFGVGMREYTEEESNGYQGYYTGIEPISTQRFLLRFDKYGKLSQIAPDYAG